MVAKNLIFFSGRPGLRPLSGQAQDCEAVQPEGPPAADGQERPPLRGARRRAGAHQGGVRAVQRQQEVDEPTSRRETIPSMPN